MQSIKIGGEKLEENKKCGWNRNNDNIYIESRDAKVVLKYPLVPSEFEIQSMIYTAIDETCRGYRNECEIKPEITVYIDDNVQMRFDLMLFSQSIPVCGIEVKKNKYSNPDQSKKQLIKYQMFSRVTGIPVLYCYGIKDAVEIIRKAIKYL
jgi:hypothetical protein